MYREIWRPEPAEKGFEGGMEWRRVEELGGGTEEWRLIPAAGCGSPVIPCAGEPEHEGDVTGQRRDIGCIGSEG
jgi:hypothetical protein